MIVKLPHNARNIQAGMGALALHSPKLVHGRLKPSALRNDAADTAADAVDTAARREVPVILGDAPANAPVQAWTKKRGDIQLPQPAQVAEGPTVGAAVGVATNLGMMAVDWAPMAVPAVGVLGGGIANLAKKGEATPVRSITTPIARAGFAVRDGINNFTGRSFADVFGRSKPAQWLGGKLEAVAEIAGRGVAKVAQVTKLDGFLARTSEQKAAKHFARLGTFVADAKTHLGDLPHDLRGPARGLIDTLSVSHAVHLQPNAIMEASEKLSVAAVKTRYPNKASVKAFSKLVDQSTKAVSTHASAGDYKNLGKTISSLPSAIAKSPVLHGLFGVSFLISAGAQLLHGAMDAKHDASDLSALKNEVKNEAPELVAQERTQALKRGALNLASAVVTGVLAVKNVLGRNVPMYAMFLPYIARQALEAFFIKPSNIPLFISCSNDFKANKQLPPEAYKALIEVLDPELAGYNPVFRNALVRELAEQRVSPPQLQQEIAKRTLVNVRLKKIIAANEALKPAVAAQEPVENAGPKTSHVARLAEGGPKKELAKKVQPTVGPITDELNSKRAAQQDTPAPQLT